MRGLILLLGLLCAAAALPFACKAGTATRPQQASVSERTESEEAPSTLTVDGIERRYYLHVPPGLDPQRPVPLLIALHGGGATARSLIESSGLDAVADREKFIVAYPEAVSRQWNNGSRGGTLKVRHGNADDVGFVSKLIDRVSSKHRIDPGRVFATGMSMGAMMCYRLACELSDRIAAIAPVSGPLTEEMKGCRPSRPVAVLAIHGTEDPIVPYEGGSYGGIWRKLGNVLSAEASARYFARLNGCGEKAEVAAPVDRVPDDGTRLVRETYSGCREGATVELLTIEGAGHVWPGGKQVLSTKLVGRVSREVDAGAIWEFLAAHPRDTEQEPAAAP